MKNKDVAELSKKVGEGCMLTFSHLNSYINPNGVVQLTVKEFDASDRLVSGQLFVDKNIKSVLRMAEESSKNGNVCKGSFDEQDTNLDYLLNRGFEIAIYRTRTEGCNYYVLKINYPGQQEIAPELYSTRTSASNGVLAVLQDAERNWAQHVIHGLMGKDSAISYNPEKGWGNF